MQVETHVLTLDPFYAIITQHFHGYKFEYVRRVPWQSICNWMFQWEPAKSFPAKRLKKFHVFVAIFRPTTGHVTRFWKFWVG
jgi:hypothetical protein